MEGNLTANLLITEIQSIMNDATTYENMSRIALSLGRPDAAKRVADALISIGLEHESKSRTT